MKNVHDNRSLGPSWQHTLKTDEIANKIHGSWDINWTNVESQNNQTPCSYCSTGNGVKIRIKLSCHSQKITLLITSDMFRKLFSVNVKAKLKFSNIFLFAFQYVTGIHGFHVLINPYAQIGTIFHKYLM